MPLQVALLLQRLQLVGDARRAAQAYRLADLTDGGRVSVPPHGVADELEYLFLPHAQRGHGADWTSADRTSADWTSADRMNASQICVHRSCAYRVCARHPLSLRRSLPGSKVTSGDELSSILCSNTLGDSRAEPVSRRAPSAVDRAPSAVDLGSRQPATSAATSAPSSQQASRSARPGGPVTQTGGRTARHCRPVVIDSTARTAPVVSRPPCTYRPNGRRRVASRHG